jgi:hypothetical protein
MTVATKADPEVIAQDIAQFESMMQQMRAGFNNGVDESEAKDKEAVKAAFGDFFDALEATVKEGHIDGGAALHLTDESMSFVAGAVVADTDKVESGLKKIDEATQKLDVKPEIEWNADEHEGVKFHTIAVAVPEDEEEAQRMFGSELNLSVGIGDKVVYVAGGDDNLKALKSAIDASAAEPNKAVPAVEVALSLGPILNFAAERAPDGEKKEIVQKIAAMVEDEASGRDHLRIVGKTVPNGLRYRLEAEEGVLRAIGAAALEAQRNAMQQQAQQ